MAGLAEVDTLRSRWNTMKHIGPAKPDLTVMIRKARMRRRFQTVDWDDVHCFIPKTGPSNNIYYGYLEVHSDFEELPNVQEVTIDHDFAANGIATATIEIDNIYYKEQTGVAGLYHVIERGWFSPFRGHQPPSLPKTHESQNEWYEDLREKSTQIVILAGYGDAKVPIFTGLISSTNIRVRPDKIIVTCRDMGQVLTDQRCFAWAKHPKVLDPITFYDRLAADNVTKEGAGARASSQDAGNAPRLALDGNNDSHWLSHRRDGPNAQEWISIKVPGGRYQSVQIDPAFAGMECFVSIYKHNDQHWIQRGLGTTNDGIPYVKHIQKVKKGRNGYGLGEDFHVGDNSTFRFTFRNLAHHKGSGGPGYYAGVTEVRAAKRILSKEAKQNKWILVNDAADVVKVILQWVGLHDWEVETTGVRLKDKLVFNRQTTFMEVIQRIAELTNYVFYIRPPDNFDEDSPDDNVQNTMGVAVFRSNQAMPDNPIERVEGVRDDKLLTGIEASLSDEPLAQHMRCRGKELPKKKGGRTLGADRTHRYMAGYLPPWSRASSIGNGGIKKVVVHYDQMLDSYQDCVIACMFIAFRQALESAKAQIQAPALPIIHLDHQVSIFDRGSGLSTRLWVAQKAMTIRTGENAHFTMTLGGSLIDFPDIVAIRQELKQALANAGYNPAPLNSGLGG